MLAAGNSLILFENQGLVSDHGQTRKETENMFIHIVSALHPCIQSYMRVHCMCVVQNLYFMKGGGDEAGEG